MNCPQHQLWYLQQPGPPLSSCRNQGNNLIFSQSRLTDSVVFEKDVHSNIRAYYYALLCLIYERTEKSSDLVQKSEREFKNIIYDHNTKPDQFEIPALKAKRKEFYNNTTLKRLITEFLQEIKVRNRKGAVMQVLNEFPILDLIMVLLVRSIICYHRRIKTPISERLPTRTIAECFWELFSIGSLEVSPSTWSFEALDWTYRSNGLYDQIGGMDMSDSLDCKPVLSRCKRVRKQSFHTITQVSYNDQFSSDEEQFTLKPDYRHNSVTSSFESIHLKLKALDLDDCASEVSIRQSVEEDFFTDRTNLDDTDMLVGCPIKSNLLSENRQPNKSVFSFKVKKG